MLPHIYPHPTCLASQAQLGQSIAVVAATPSPAAPQGGAGIEAVAAAPPILLASLHAAQQRVPRLHLGPGQGIATTVTAAAGSFRLLALGGGGADTAAALRCRFHGCHVGLAVSAPGAAPDPEEEVGEGDEGGDAAGAAAGDGDAECSLEDPSSTGVDGGGNGIASSSCSEAEVAGAGAAAAAGQGVLLAWAPQATRAQGWGLYEFELECGE